MKNQKGFIVPLLLIIIALLLVGGGAYVFTQKNQASPAVSGNVELPQATSTEQTATDTTPTTQSSGLTGVSLPVGCHVVGAVGDATHPASSYNFMGGTQLIDCGSRNNNARGTLGPVLIQQGWVLCDSGLAHASWWKDGVTTSVNEGSGSGPFGLIQEQNSPNCSSTNTTSATQPSVTVLSPNGGEQWAIGDTKTILWNYNLLNTTDAGRTLVSIELWGVNNNKNYLIKNGTEFNNLVVKTGDTSSSYTLTIPVHPSGRKGGIDNSQIIEPGIYQIYIEGMYPTGEEKSGIVGGKSSSFTITN